MLPARILTDLIGKAYRENGRGPDAYDCAGLVVELQRRMGRALDIPATPGSKARQDVTMRAILAQRWAPLAHPQPGCVLFFRNEAHVATMIDAQRFIHADESAGGVVIESLLSPLWKSRPKAFYLPADHPGGVTCPN